LPVGLAVGAADQAPRACDSAHGLTGKERAISRLVAPGSRVTSEPDPTTVSRSAPFIRSEPCVCRRVRGWDLEFESGLLQRGVRNEPWRSEYNKVWSDHVANFLSIVRDEAVGDRSLRTRKLIAIVVAVSNNPPDARAKKNENCQGKRPPSWVLGVLRQIGEQRYLRDCD
jgi:hypothetical protein